MADDRDEAVLTLPWPVRVAGIIWLFLGCVSVLATLPFLILAVMRPPLAGGLFVLAVLGGLTATQFLLYGWGAVRGDLPDPLRPGVLSAGLSVILFGLAYMTTNTLVVASGFLGIGVLLLAGGLLALGTRRQYLAWRIFRYVWPREQWIAQTTVIREPDEGTGE